MHANNATHVVQMTRMTVSRAARPPTHFRRGSVAGVGPNVRGKLAIGAAARAPALHLAPTRGAARTVGTTVGAVGTPVGAVGITVGAVGTTVGRQAAARGQHAEQRRSQLVAWLGLG